MHWSLKQQTLTYPPEPHPPSKMPPKTLNGRGGRAPAEPSFARSTVQAFTSQENRSVVTAIGLFAVSLPQMKKATSRPAGCGADDALLMRRHYTTVLRNSGYGQLVLTDCLDRCYLPP